MLCKNCNRPVAGDEGVRILVTELTGGITITLVKAADAPGYVKYKGALCKRKRCALDFLNIQLDAIYGPAIYTSPLPGKLMSRREASHV